MLWVILKIILLLLIGVTLGMEVGEFRRDYLIGNMRYLVGDSVAIILLVACGVLLIWV